VLTGNIQSKQNNSGIVATFFESKAFKVQMTRMVCYIKAVLILFCFLGLVFCVPLSTLVQDRTIVAYGDSLTHGLYLTEEQKDRIGHHPYTIELKRLFEGVNVVIEEKGINGEKATELMYKLSPVIKGINRSRPPIFFVILAGTNDLGARATASTIVWHVIKMHNYVQSYALSLKRNVYTIAVAIPQCGWPIKESERLLANKELKRYAERCNSSVAFLDWNNEFNVTVPENKPLWSADKVHFSRAGYDRIGQLVYNTMNDFAAKKSDSSLSTLDFTKICV
jgi:lysophospholipase L1-like esterase